MATRGRAAKRRELKQLVEAGDVGAIVRWASGVKDAPALLVTRVFELDDRKRWAATLALAEVLSGVARRGDLESVRVIIRRFIWNMMDESGGLAWHGPEAIAEILVSVPELAAEYGRIVASYVDEEPFEAGALYLIARLGPERAELFADLLPRVVESLGSPDPCCRARALLALAALRPGTARARARLLLGDQAEVTLYDRAAAGVVRTTVARIATDVVRSEPAASSGPPLRGAMP